MSTFNPDQFLATETGEVGDTKFIQVPAGEYPGQITRVTPRQIESKKTGETYTLLEITWTFTDPAVKAATAMDEPSARQTIFLDLKENGALDFSPNKGVNLSRLRDAVGQQRNGRPWSPSHLMGATAMCLIKHEIDDNGDPRAVVSKVVALTRDRAAPARAHA